MLARMAQRLQRLLHKPESASSGPTVNLGTVAHTSLTLVLP